MIARALLCLALACGLAGCSSAQAEDDDSACVILLHGLARSDVSLLLMQEALETADYHVVNDSYPSTAQSIAELADTIIPQERAECEAHVPGARIDVVTHSMGGILLRSWARRNPTAEWGRVVMLAPPNGGSELVDVLGELAPFRWVNGPAGIELGTGPLDTPKSLGPVAFSLGVIAGNRSLNAFYSTLLPGPDDGKVTVAATKVEGMKSHITLPVTHTFMMNNPRVIVQTISYLRDERFVPDLTLGEILVDAIFTDP